MRHAHPSTDMKKIMTAMLGGMGVGLVIFLGIAGIHMLRQGTAGVSHMRSTSTRNIATTPTVTPIPKHMTYRIPILMYHYVEYVQDKGDTIRQSLDITPYTFEQQVKTLTDNGYTFLTAKELGDAVMGKFVPPQRSVVLTFDDGYRDFYTDAFPILKKYHAKATVYMISGFIGFRNYMTEEQLREVAASGLIDVGSHTVHHMSLKKLPLTTVKQELQEAKTQIEDLIGQPVVSFAYPNGSFDDQAVQQVEEAGYTTAVTTLPGIEENDGNRFKFFRIRPGGRVGDALTKHFDEKVFSAY